MGFTLTDSRSLTLTPVDSPAEIPVTWLSNPPIRSGTYTWSLTFQVVPIPWVSDWVAQLMAGAVDDQARLNQVLYEAGVTGTAEILDKRVYYKRNFMGAVYEFTIQWKVRLTVQEGASLVAWAVLLPVVIALIPVVGYIVVGLVILGILSDVKEIAEAPISPNLALIVAGAVAVAYLSRG